MSNEDHETRIVNRRKRGELEAALASYEWQLLEAKKKVRDLEVVVESLTLSLKPYKEKKKLKEEVKRRERAQAESLRFIQEMPSLHGKEKDEVEHDDKR